MKNRQGRKILEQIYGEGCFMERAGIRKITPEEEKLFKKTIKGFKKLDRTITYHHMRERHNGGKVTIENGANLAAYNHAWLHQQSPEVRNSINRQLQEFKMSIVRMSFNDKCEQIDMMSEQVPLRQDNYVSIKAYDNTEQDLEKRRQKFNRAKTNRETQKMIDEILYER